MKKIILAIAFIATGMVASAQVGIGNEDPKTTLHVTGANNGAALTAADGVTVPRVSTDMRDSGTAVSGVELGQLVYSTNVDSIGFWYWAGATEKWNPLVAVAAAPNFQIQKSRLHTVVGPIVWAADDYSVSTTALGGTSNLALPDAADLPLNSVRCISSMGPGNAGWSPAALNGSTRPILGQPASVTAGTGFCFVVVDQNGTKVWTILSGR